MVIIPKGATRVLIREMKKSYNFLSMWNKILRQFKFNRNKLILVAYFASVPYLPSCSV